MSTIETPIFLIPFGEHGLPGPLCRILREEEDRYYVSLDKAVDANGANKNRRGIKPDKETNANLWVPKSLVLVMGPDVNVELQQKLVNGLAPLKLAIAKHSAESNGCYLLLKTMGKTLTDKILAGKQEDVQYPTVKTLPAGSEDERIKCANMAGKMEMLGPEFAEIAEYLKARSGLF